MSPTHVVVDGSNIATEGRTTPSLGQLDDAVRQFQDEFPDAEPIVVVDATFGHRIDPAERKAFEAAVSHGEIVSPPAGAIGRGDAFVLRIAERVSGQVLSNDSFQEFLPGHPWLFDEGRLIGGKPVPGVGWIFTPRRPVRGARSRAEERKATTSGGGGRDGAASASSGRRGGRSAVLEAVEAAAAQATEAASAPADGQAGATPETPSPSSAKRRRRRRSRSGDPAAQAAVQAAIEAATEEAVGPGAVPDERKRRAKVAAGLVHGPQAVNDPLTFLTFITQHPLGDEVRGSVSNFVSHGAMVDVGDMHCYVPLSGLGSPAPASARSVLRKGETRLFVVVSLDPARRGAQLALPEVAVPAEARAAATKRQAASGARSRGRTPESATTATTATTVKPTKATKATKTTKATKATKPTKPTKPAQATKSTKTTKATKAAKSAQARTTSMAQPTKAAKGDRAATTSKRSRRAGQGAAEIEKRTGDKRQVAQKAAAAGARPSQRGAGKKGSRTKTSAQVMPKARKTTASGG